MIFQIKLICNRTQHIIAKNTNISIYSCKIIVFLVYLENKKFLLKTTRTNPCPLTCQNNELILNVKSHEEFHKMFLFSLLVDASFAYARMNIQCCCYVFVLFYYFVSSSSSHELCKLKYTHVTEQSSEVRNKRQKKNKFSTGFTMQPARQIKTAFGFKSRTNNYFSISHHFSRFKTLSLRGRVVLNLYLRQSIAFKQNTKKKS